ncbi:MAG: hypothetical protein MUO76_13070 [Anaerolineaceae bacterium]|nr:hypothetical protein [Anaerolineaceae bacterium]
MARGRSSSKWIIILGIVGGIFILTTVVVGIWGYNQFFRTPEIQIIQPTEPLLINTGEGIMLVSIAKSSNGIDRVEFNVNDQFQGLVEPDDDDAEEVVAQFPWMPGDTGVYNLSVIAYDQNNRPSKKASMPVAVISSHLTAAETSQLEEDLAQSPVINVVSPSGDTNEGDSGAESNGQQVLDGNQGAGNLDEIEDQQPQITSLDIGIHAFVDRVDFFAFTEAFDDEGVQEIILKVFQPGIFDPVFTGTSACNGDVSCDAQNQLDISEGDYVVAAMAIDVSGLHSEIVTKNFHMPSIEEALNEDFEILEELNLDLPEGFFDAISLHFLGEGEEDIPSQRPNINSFEVQVNREGSNEVVILGNADDDNGISTFDVSIFKVEDQSFVDNLVSLCQGSLRCDISESLTLADGSYVLIAMATDIDLNISDAVVKPVEVISNHPAGEPPSLVVGRDSHVIPSGVAGQLELDENGVFRGPSNYIVRQRLQGQDEEESDSLDQNEININFEGNALDYVNVDTWYQPAGAIIDANIVIAIGILPGIPFPEGPNPIIKVTMHPYVGEEIHTILRLTPSVVENGAYEETPINVSHLCGKIDFYASFIIGEDHLHPDYIEKVLIGTIELTQCTAQSPRLLSLFSAFHYDQSGTIEVKWEDNQPPDYEPLTLTDYYLLTKRKILPTGIISETITIDFEGFGHPQYTDNDVEPDTVYDYSMRRVGANGFVGVSGNYLNIRTASEVDVNTRSTDWQPNR